MRMDRYNRLVEEADPFAGISFNRLVIEAEPRAVQFGSTNCSGTDIGEPGTQQPLQ